MKRTAALDEIQTIAWHNALGGFSPEILNAAVLEIALTDNRFPEVGDLYQACRRRAIRAGLVKIPYSPLGGDKESASVTEEEIRGIASRFGLKV